MIETIDLVIRSACVGICALVAIHFATIRPVSRKTISAFTFLIAGIAVIIGSSMIVVNASDNFPYIHATIFALTPAMIAWGLLELFEDDFEIHPWQIIFLALSIPTHYVSQDTQTFKIICGISSLLIYGYLFYVTIKTGGHDLVEARCKFRFWFMGSAALTGVAFTTFFIIYGKYLPVSLQLLNAGMFLVLSIIFAYWALNVREQIWALPQNAAMKRPENLSPAEMALLTKLNASMQADIWREEGLTIRKLAETLDTPEHRLRKVINQGLGYRNFAAFVNEHRITAACAVLADPVKADVPVITIAYEVGYASLGPFNRAFKQIVGESPTEYRKRSFSHA